MLADLCLSSSLQFSAVGIDGCRAGWVAAFQLDGEPVLAVVETLSELSPHLSHETTVMIDMPIGLLNDDSCRQCDALARERLRPYRYSSVFGVPPRPVTRISDYPRANALSRELTGKGLSKQSFYLFPKIAELGLSSEEFSDRLLEDEKVAVVSGHAFGADDYVRLSLSLIHI